MTRYNTNLAAEFYLLSCLHRLGMTANLTLGNNQKGVNIVVAHDAGDVVTVEVKGLAGKYEWPANNLETPKNPDKHFVVLVSFKGSIDDPKMPPPSVWIIPFRQAERFKQRYTSWTNVSRSPILSEGTEFKHAWGLITRTPE